MDGGFAFVGLIFVDDLLDAIMLVSSVFWRLYVGSVDTDVGEVWSTALAKGRVGVDMMMLSLLWVD